MPKGMGRPFNKPERAMKGTEARNGVGLNGVKYKSKATASNEHRESNRYGRKQGEKVINAVGLAPFVRTGRKLETKPKKK